VRQYPFDDGRIFGARDHFELPAAAPAELDVNGEHSLESLRPGQGSLPVSVRYLTIPGRLFGGCTSSRYNLRAIRARRREYAMIHRQVCAGFWHQRNQGRVLVLAVELSVLTHRAAVDTKERIHRADADRAGQQRHDADIAPYAYLAARCQADQNQTGDHAQSAVQPTFIRLHSFSPVALVDVRKP
jgi:hypothetical protein